MSEYIVSDKVWYYLKEGTKFGPYNESEMIKLIKHGIVEANDQIWMLDLKNWIALKDSLFSYYMPK